MFTHSQSVFKSRKLAKETSQSFKSYFLENFPPVKRLKVKIDPHNRQIIASASFGCRRLYARARTVEQCFGHFMCEYQQKVSVDS